MFSVFVLQYSIGLSVPLGYSVFSPSVHAHLVLVLLTEVVVGSFQLVLLRFFFLHRLFDVYGQCAQVPFLLFPLIYRFQDVSY